MTILHNDTEFADYTPADHAAMLEDYARIPETIIRWVFVAGCIVGTVLAVRGWLT